MKSTGGADVDPDVVIGRIVCFAGERIVPLGCCFAAPLLLLGAGAGAEEFVSGAFGAGVDAGAAVSAALALLLMICQQCFLCFFQRNSRFSDEFTSVCFVM